MKKWIKILFWQPFESFCIKFPLIPLKIETTTFDNCIVQIKINNIVTRSISKFGGGYDYSVIYLIQNTILIDTGFSWSKKSFRSFLLKSGINKNIKVVINTHAHEDHVGNNDIIEQNTSAIIYAHPLAISAINYPNELPWYRSFMFGSNLASKVKEIPKKIQCDGFDFEIIHTPGHSPDHICVFEKNKKWLFSGDLYVSPDLDSQLKDVDGPDWINSIEKIIALEPKWLFDGHGLIFEGELEVKKHLLNKLEFLVMLRDKIYFEAKSPASILEITKRVFNEKSFTNKLSSNDGWLSILTSSDFSRSNLVSSFIRKMQYNS